jgi:IS30 family transposase
LHKRKLYQKSQKTLSRDRTTIWREIKRNSRKTGYRAFSASKQAEARVGSRQKEKRKLTKNLELAVYVEDKLRQKRSPSKISQRLKIECAMDISMQISHESIYQYLYGLHRGELKRTLTEALSQDHKYRHQRKKRGSSPISMGK